MPMPVVGGGGGGAVQQMMKRGALIVLEGCDKAGKSTHSKLLVEALNHTHGKTTHLMNFPDRTTEIGKMLDAYLKCQKDVKDEAIHLLFSANRWELVPKIKELLLRGETIILDRYAFSGVAFSAAKGTLGLEWCMSPDIGLPQPDKVIFLNIPESEAAGRGDYGKERYEQKEFQGKVKEIFFKLKERDSSYWTVVDTNRITEEVHKEILQLTLDTIVHSENNPILPLWNNTVGFPLQSKDSREHQKTDPSLSPCKLPVQTAL